MIENQKVSVGAMNINTQNIKLHYPALTTQPTTSLPQPDWQPMFDTWNKVGHDLTQAITLATNRFAEAFKPIFDAFVRAFTPYARKHMLLHPSRQTRAFLATKQRTSFTPHAQPKRHRHRR